MDRVFDNPSGSTRQSSESNRPLLPVEVAVHEPIQPPITRMAPQVALVERLCATEKAIAPTREPATAGSEQRNTPAKR